MFEKEGIRYALEKTVGTECLSMPIEDFHFIDLSDEQQEKAQCWKDGAEFGYNKGFKEGLKQKVNITTISDCPIKDEWHYVKDKLPPEPESDGEHFFPKTYICAYSLNNEYDDYEIGEFMYYGNGDWNGENKEYPIYAWLDKPTEIPTPPKENE